LIELTGVIKLFFEVVNRYTMRESQEISIGIAEDHLFFQKGLKTCLEIEGFQVNLQVFDGRELIEKIGNVDITVLLLDLRMPVIDGFAVLDYLHSIKSPVHVLVLSGLGDDASIGKAVQAGAKGFVSKDTSLEELKKAIRIIADNGYYFSGGIGGKIMQKLLNPGITALKPEFTDKEMQFLQLSCTDLSYKEIADKMNMGTRSIDNYRDTVYQKLDIKSRNGLIVYAIKNQLVKLDG